MYFMYLTLPCLSFQIDCELFCFDCSCTVNNNKMWLESLVRDLLYDVAVLSCQIRSCGEGKKQRASPDTPH